MRNEIEKKIKEKLKSKLSIKMRNRRNTYAQLGEDRIIDFYLGAICGLQRISYCDIGANHPFWLSNTALLDENYIINKAVLVEPNPELRRALKKRKYAVVETVGICGGAGAPMTLPYYEMNANTLNTFSKEEAKKNADKGYKIERVLEIPVISVNELLNKYFVDCNLDVLSVDVEGMDYEIISGIDYSVYRPKIICVETSHMERNRMDEFMKEKGYKIFGITSENSIYIEDK